MDRQNRRNFGALHSAHLPKRRPHRPYPYGCDFYQPEWLTDGDRTMAIACGEVHADDGDAIHFTDGCSDGNTVRLHAPGIYYAVYTLHMPGNQRVHTNMHLMLDDQILSESHLHIEHDGDDTQHVHAHAMFNIHQPMHLRLMTHREMHLCNDGPEPLITLAVFRIG